MSDELRERISNALSNAHWGSRTDLSLRRRLTDAVMSVLREEFGEPETEYGIQWRNDDYVTPIGGDNMAYVENQLARARRFNISAVAHVRTIHTSEWRPIDMERETQ